MKFYVYAYFNPLKSSNLHECGFEPFYVGKGVQARNRSHDHLKECYWETDSNRLKVNTLKKIKRAGVTPLIITLFETDVEEDAFREEIRYIALWGRRDMKRGPLTNLTGGGEGSYGRVCTEGTRLKLARAATGKRATDEARAKMSKTRTGKKMNPDAVRRSAISRTGMKHTEKALQRMRESQARLHSDPERAAQWVERQRASQTGRRASNTTKNLMKESSPRSTPLMLFGVRYPSLNEAVKQTGLSRTVIRRDPSYVKLQNLRASVQPVENTPHPG